MPETRRTGPGQASVMLRRSSRSPSALSRLIQSKRPGQLGQRRDQVLRSSQNLNSDVVCARVEVLVEAGSYRVGCAVGHQGIDQAVAAGAGDVVVGEPQPPPAVQVIGEVEVNVE